MSWGAVTIGQAFIHGRGKASVRLVLSSIRVLTSGVFATDAFIAMRLLVGLFEAGFYPTAVAYLSFFYPRFDLAIRVAVFYGQYAIAGAFSGALCTCLP